MEFSGRIEGLDRAIKQNFMIFIGALTGMVVAETFLSTETGVSLVVALGAVIAFNIGNLAAKKIRDKPGYDERDIQNLDQGLAYGFIVMTTLTGVGIATSLSLSKPEILIISVAAAVLIMICKNLRQTGIRGLKK
ncbi:hypothetical protein ACK3SF_01485 [Candidatus Nanosalina sp. VS9-1]|uniref:hypothetical protein n=1 Tax=Candidatus Nanosalina sp. VS9-1 TaxID=3388566 RepID=UPI0039E028B2